MDQYTFKGREKTLSYIFIALGVVGLLWSFLTDTTAHHTRFWGNMLQNTVLFTGIGFMGIFLNCCFTLAYAGWFTQFKRVFEAVSMFLPVGLFFMAIIILGAYMHWHHLYHWTDHSLIPADDIVLIGKLPFLNLPLFAIVTFVVVGIWAAFAWKFRQISIQEDSLSFGANYKKTKMWAAIFLPIGGFSSAFIIWYWIMSIDSHWYSTMFAWYVTASWLVSFLAVVILALLYLKSKGHYKGVTQDHFHDLGKYTFGFSIFWTYLWFSQFMLIWYANVGEETVYFDIRHESFKAVFYGNLLINFVFPFFVLMRNSNKRKFGTMALVAIVVLFGHWVDFFQMVRPGLYAGLEHTAHKADIDAGSGHVNLDAMHAATSWFHFPVVSDILMMLFFLGVFIYVVCTYLAKAPLVAKNDPYLEESLHHHVV